jgi:hypothetical protein
MKNKIQKATLLEKARGKRVKRYPEFTEQDVELAVAWLKGEINNAQADYAYKVRASQSLKKMARCFREMYAGGRMRLEASLR